MAEETKDAGAQGETQEPQAQPTINIVGQYVRDMSFEVPGAPASILPGGANPSFNVSINVSVKKQEDDIYAVEIPLNVKAERDKAILFNIELIYGGLFRIKNIPENQVAPVLMIECPRLIFPFARQMVATVSQSGGFPPVMLEPVDFTAIYRQNLQRMAKATQEQGDASKAATEAAPKPDDKGGKTVN